MANANKPFGLRVAKYLDGSPWNGQTNLYYTSATNTDTMYIGDLVKLDVTNGGSLGTTKFPGQPAIARFVAGNANCRGVVVGFLPEPDFSQDPNASYARKYRVASTERWALVADDEDILWEIQEVNSGTALTVTEIGLNADVVATQGSTFTGISAMVLDNTTEAATTTLPLKIVASVLKEDNEYGSIGQRWLVKLNTIDLYNVAGI